MNNSGKKQSIAVVGGGLAGIAAALQLAKSKDFNVSIFEKDDKLGGLSSFLKWRDIAIDRFYHVILERDLHTVEFLKDLGLEENILWKNVKTGFYGDNKLVSLSSVRDYLRFPFLSFWSKFRLGLGILYSVRYKDTSRLEDITTEQWLIRIFDEKVFRKFWQPLLRAKLGDAQSKIAATYIWSTINRLYGARTSGTKSERLGYVKGGFYKILHTIDEKLKYANVQIHLESQVMNLESNSLKQQLRLNTESASYEFDNVLFTVPVPEVIKILRPDVNNVYWEKLAAASYLGVICVVLILKHKLSPYYLINLLDEKLPFTGIIESTNVISSNELGGLHLVYLPKYIDLSDEYAKMQSSKITSHFINNLKQVFPEFKEEDILHTVVLREKYVQPIFAMGSILNSINFQTPTKNVFYISNSMAQNMPINNDLSIRLGKEAAGYIIDIRT